MSTTEIDSPEQDSINAAELGKEKAPVDIPDLEEAPDGGLRAWLVTIGASCVFFSALGFSNAFGVFEEYYLTHQLKGQSPDKIAWIGSLGVFLQFVTGNIGGPLFDRYGAWIMRPAFVLYVFAVMMTSLCKEYYQFMLAQGILSGIVIGFLQFPAMAAVSQFFNKKRAAALGVVVAGSSIGGVVIPIALSKMLNSSSLGFGWSVRVIGFIMIPLLGFACFAITSRLPPRTTSFFLWKAFKEPKFLLLSLALFFMLLGAFTPLFYIPTYAVSRGVDPTLASYLVAIVNAASTFGRVIPGILADKFGRLNIFAFGAFISGIITLCWNKAETTAALIVYSIAIGFSSGTIISGGTAAFTECATNPQELGTYIGMGIGLSSFAALIGAPVNGAIVNRYGGFLEASIFSGVMILAGGGIVLRFRHDELNTMAMRSSLEPHGPKGTFERLAIKTFAVIGTLKPFRGNARLVGIAFFVLVAVSVFSLDGLMQIGIVPDRARVLKWEGSENEGVNVHAGLRIVVFGGGDIATPNRASWKLGGPNAAWTDILCLQLNCNLYLSFVPLIENSSGAIVSNSLFEAALARTSSFDNDSLSGLNYSWLAENYPAPFHQDLGHQVEAFLSNPRSPYPPRETLWVFNIGFWDIWHLAALPRKLASRVIETQTQHIFSHLELLYEEAHNNESIAFSDYYAGMDPAVMRASPESDLPRAPFRVLIPKPFDISLTPGFDNARFTPPLPHTKAEQLRNAAFLTQHWDKVIQDMLNEWIRLPDPEEFDTGEDRLSEIEDVDLLLEKKSMKVNGFLAPPARREAITYDVSSYVRDLIVDHQLRSADIVDHNGLGSTMVAEGYSEGWEPCIKRNDTFLANTESAAGDDDDWSVCSAPNKHLFWSEFTVNRRAIFEIGRRAAELLKRHMQMDAEWYLKAQQASSSLHRDSIGGT
ncbi:major facilitator superfamily domain-containing protein [Hypoxylon trugodes]|uniref:major facilitator superfamily domain-containing protein n=1 Tax=Hypoxylon trugodes TaxID=326681 RepID=UPI0021A08286|nr:major facilitator superfamily domain-containing protein [Hypoxylon trugodes]KAI1388514.1 major facilitator superfamily domain-containing protein [Hypoxylon trugodes]